MKKWLWLLGKYGAALMLALALTLLPLLPALAADEESANDSTTESTTEGATEGTTESTTEGATESTTEGTTENAGEGQNSSMAPMWDDLSYSKFLLRNHAFYQMNDKVLKAETMEALVEEMKKCDQWAQYYPLETYSSFMEFIVGDFVGIGVYLREENGDVIVVGVIANSPAEKAGFKNGDRIVEVDGVSTRDANMDELQTLLQGEENSLVTIKYERDGKTNTLLMTRKRIVQPSMEYWFVEGNIGYIRIDNFTTHTGEELAAAIKSLKKQGMIALVVDLRNCPGGEIEGAVESSGVLAGEGPMMFFVDRYGWQSFVPVDEAEPLGMPLAVLINGNTASSAELVAANVQDAQTGVLVGETSYGKGVVQTVVMLPSGAGISFTTEKYMSHGYQDVDAQGGVLPDIYITGEDEQRDKGISWVKEQLKNPAFVKFYANLNGYSRGGAWQNTPATVMMEGGSAYVPLLLTLTQLGWETEDRDGFTYLEHNEKRLILDAANNSLVNAKGSHKLLSKDGQLYMPAALLRDYGFTVTWSAPERSITVEK